MLFGVLIVHTYCLGEGEGDLTEERQGSELRAIEMTYLLIPKTSKIKKKGLLLLYYLQRKRKG